MTILRSLCVYCGSAYGKSSIHADAAVSLATELVRRDITLIFGGGNVGLMGCIADAVLEQGGEVIGVIPQALMAREVGHQGLTQLHIVRDMHERKAMMADLSDAFIAMPGGLGTLEELFEMLTWAQLGFHKKPIGLLNTGGFYDGLIGFIAHQINEGFIRQGDANLLHHDQSAFALLNKLAHDEGHLTDSTLPQEIVKTLLP